MAPQYPTTVNPDSDPIQRVPSFQFPDSRKRKRSRRREEAGEGEGSLKVRWLDLRGPRRAATPGDHQAQRNRCRCHPCLGLRGHGVAIGHAPQAPTGDGLPAPRGIVGAAKDRHQGPGGSAPVTTTRDHYRGEEVATMIRLHFDFPVAYILEMGGGPVRNHNCLGTTPIPT